MRGLGVFTLISVQFGIQASFSGFQCPQAEGLYPDPEDCRNFFQCSGWTPYKFQCQEGLLFNAEKVYCDWPANVDCSTEATTTTESSRSSTSASTFSARTTPNTTPGSTTPKLRTTTIESSSTTVTTTTFKSSTTVKVTSTSTTTTTTPKSSTTVKVTSTSTTPPRSSTTVKVTSTTTTPRSSTMTTTPKSTTLTSTSTTAQVITTVDSGQLDCYINTMEPITDEIRALRIETCTAPNSIVDNVFPGSPDNPENVKILEKIFPRQKFGSEFPKANIAYTYENLLKAFAKFPAVCKTEELCRRSLATIFAHFQQETAGLIYINEINQDWYCADWSDWVVAAYPCQPQQKYFGRGAKQLSWNYNYGALSRAMFGDAKVLLENPSLVSDTWLNFASAIWFFITPQPPKPSMLSILDGSWTPNSHDLDENRLIGFGSTIMVINGLYECGPNPSNPTGSTNRQSYYKKFAADFGVDISGEKLDCADMQSFDREGSSNPAIYWAPEIGCKLASWQTAYSALIEGDYQKCLEAEKLLMMRRIP